MKKVTYKTSNLFSLKRYSHSNINCQSYEYPTTATIRGAILGQIIRLEGVEKARDIFEDLKKSDILVQYNPDHKTIGKGIKRVANNVENDTFGYREFVDIKEISFYIDTNIRNVDLYLKNIDYIGTSDSLVYLDNISETSVKNVLLKWNEEDDVDIYENADWIEKVTFDDLYIYNEKHKLNKCSNTFMCKVVDLE